MRARARRVTPQQAAFHRPVLQPPDLIVAQAQQLCRPALDMNRKKHVQSETTLAPPDFVG